MDSELIGQMQDYVRRRRTHRVRCRSSDCARGTAPDVPAAALPKANFSAAFVAWVSYLKAGVVVGNTAGLLRTACNTIRSEEK